MSTVKNYIASVVIGLCFCTSLAAPSPDCKRSWCTGPLLYYDEIGCTPIYQYEASCCPKRYNCDIWKNLPRNKCLVNGHVYEPNEPLRPNELHNPCLRCNCSSIGRFICEKNYYSGPIEKGPGCYLGGGYLLDCGTSIVTCNNSSVTCIVDGKTYKEGDTFKPHAEPGKTCVCLEGYTGVNSEEFCVWSKSTWCGNAVLNTNLIRRQCAPLYSEDNSLQTDCNAWSVCFKDDTYYIKMPRTNLYGTTGDSQEDSTDDDDYIIERRSNDNGTIVDGPIDSENHCVLGNLMIRIGEMVGHLNFGSSYVTCVCEVPPVPTCRYIERT